MFPCFIQQEDEASSIIPSHDGFDEVTIDRILERSQLLLGAFLRKYISRVEGKLLSSFEQLKKSMESDHRKQPLHKDQRVIKWCDTFSKTLGNIYVYLNPLLLTWRMPQVSDADETCDCMTAFKDSVDALEICFERLEGVESIIDSFKRDVSMGLERNPEDFTGPGLGLGQTNKPTDPEIESGEVLLPDEDERLPKELEDIIQELGCFIKKLEEPSALFEIIRARNEAKCFAVRVEACRLRDLKLQSAIVLHRCFKKRMEDPIMSRRFKLYLEEHNRESKNSKDSEAAKETNPSGDVRTSTID